QEAVLYKRWLVLDTTMDMTHGTADQSHLSRELVVIDRQRMEKSAQRAELGDDTPVITGWADTPELETEPEPAQCTHLFRRFDPRLGHPWRCVYCDLPV